jgi:biopolymer transport protein ExbD
MAIKRRNRSTGAVRLNITSMVDMFTLMVVFLLKNYSSQGQLVTPSKDLKLPISSVEKLASQNLSTQGDFLIQPLFDNLSKRYEEEKKSAEVFKTKFKGKVSIQGDVEIPYRILTRIMYTCGQAGYPTMNLVVYRKG